MKKCIFSLAFLSLTLFTQAQVYQVFWSNGKILFAIPTSIFDSVSYEFAEDMDGLQTQSSITESIYHPKGALSGEFFVSPTKKVCFSKGNLQYRASDGIWRFAENQYDYIGNNNASQSSNAWIDVFGYGTSGWSGSGAVYFKPWDAYCSSDKIGGYLNKSLVGEYANADWGVYNKISNGENEKGIWRTLSQSEWEYIFTHHKWTIVNVSGVQGLILLPNSFQNPLNVTINYPSCRHRTNGTDKNYYLSFANITYLTTEQFITLQNAGVVFLPCGGYRYSIGMMDVGTFGNYWTSTAGKNIWFTSAVLYYNSNAERWAGLQVRLVRDIEGYIDEYVDLGLPSGTRWKKTNEGGDNAQYYTYDEAVSRFGNKLPTKQQLEELINNCTWTWTGSGCKVTGPNGNSINLPAEHDLVCGDVVPDASSGSYWSSTPLDADQAWSLFFYSDAVRMNPKDRRYFMQSSVRLVQ